MKKHQILYHHRPRRVSESHPTRTRDEVFRVTEIFEGMLISLLSILYQPFHH